MTALLEIKGLTASYGLAPALVDLNLSIDQSEIVGVVGPNGAGKTTLLRALSGLVPDVTGTARLEGAELLHRPPHQIVRSGFVHVPEGRGTLAPLTVRENLSLASLQLPARQRDKRVREVTELFPVLGRLSQARAGLLSGGEQQMLAIARGILLQPTVLAIDEPSIGLAPRIVTEIIDMLRDIVTTGVALLLVEQNASVIKDLANRIEVLVGGRIYEAHGETDVDLITQMLGSTI